MVLPEKLIEGAEQEIIGGELCLADPPDPESVRIGKTEAKWSFPAWISGTKTPSITFLSVSLLGKRRFWVSLIVTASGALFMSLSAVPLAFPS